MVLTLLLGPYLLFFQSKLSANDVSSPDSKPVPQIGKQNQFPVKDDFFVAKLWISELFSILQSSFPRGRQVDQNRRFLLVAFSLSHNIQNIQNPPLLDFVDWLCFGAISFLFPGLFDLSGSFEKHWATLRKIGQHCGNKKKRESINLIISVRASGARSETLSANTNIQQTKTNATDPKSESQSTWLAIHKQIKTRIKDAFKIELNLTTVNYKNIESQLQYTS